MGAIAETAERGTTAPAAIAAARVAVAIARTVAVVLFRVVTALALIVRMLAAETTVWHCAVGTIAFA
jgi:hypothetical protein